MKKLIALISVNAILNCTVYSQGLIYGTTNGDLTPTSPKGMLFGIDPNSMVTTTIHVFPDPLVLKDGKNPAGTIVQFIDGKYYGMTRTGGEKDMGIIYSYDPSNLTNPYKIEFSFDGIGLKSPTFRHPGANPVGNLLPIGDCLYGTTLRGGANNGGALFCFKPANSTTLEQFDILKDFTGPTVPIPFNSFDGHSPSILIAGLNKTIYGITTGWDNLPPVTQQVRGTVYSYDLNAGVANPFKTLIRFNFGTAANVSNPISIIPGPDPVLYGVAHSGPNNNRSKFFKYDIIANKFLASDFPTSAGKDPLSSLVISLDGKFVYGSTSTGGALNGNGTVFKYDIANGSISPVFAFDNAITKGSTPSGNLIQLYDGFSTYLVGMTNRGGTNNLGTIFKLNLGNLSQTIKSFSATDGNSPYAYNFLTAIHVILLPPQPPTIKVYGTFCYCGQKVLISNSSANNVWKRNGNVVGTSQFLVVDLPGINGDNYTVTVNGQSASVTLFPPKFLECYFYVYRNCPPYRITPFIATTCIALLLIGLGWLLGQKKSKLKKQVNKKKPLSDR